eukprot:CAMPEP_0182443648 /NCGR_PEP_ID=MMETSP1172-20130603/2331_1 /TAXON_ID=708627 /ORGANISM="Timspurckia oligopyrenoides, Strain CCMP3278" /LENGTH=833 /DNA_ID=CAMNT_0024639001 /DNA_START=451 /DNA_END=2953 /DNA_ORIENTATION=+
MSSIQYIPTTNNNFKLHFSDFTKSKLKLTLLATETSKKRPLLRILGNTVTDTLGYYEIDLYTLATGPVKHSIQMITSKGIQSCFRIEFDAIVQELTRCEIQLSDVSLDLDHHWLSECLESEKSNRLNKFYVLYAFVGGNERVNKREISSEKVVRGDRLLFGDLNPMKHCIDLVELTKGEVVIELHDATNSNHVVALVRISVHCYWHALFTNAQVVQKIYKCGQGLREDDACIGEIRLRLSVKNAPSFVQLRGGVHTETGISDARPLLMGVRLPLGNSTDSSIRAPALSHFDDRVWLMDSFGYKFVYSQQLKLSSWESVENRAVVVEERERERDRSVYSTRVLRNGVFVFEFENGMTRYIDPKQDRNECRSDSTRIHPLLTVFDSCLERNASPIRESIDVSEVSRELNVFDENQLRQDALDCAAEWRESNGVRIVKENMFLTEMRWNSLASLSPTRPSSCGVGSEGHSLVSVGNGDVILKFGGGTGRGWLNDLHAFNVQSLKWSAVSTNGPTPIGRTGHCAVSLGQGSRMFVFGGTSRNSRLQHLDVLDVYRSTWCPFSLSTETIPSKRTRATMNALENQTSALLFGGREGYRFLGDKYCDDLFLFDATRTEWFPVRPRSNLMPAPRAGHVSELINGRQLFVHGGFDDGACFYNDTWLFDVVSCQWTRTPYPNEVSPSARESHASVSLGGSVLIYGGSGESGQLYNDVWVYDTSSLRWAGQPRCTGASPGVRSGVRASVMDSERILLVGGDGGFSYYSDSHVLEVGFATVHDLETRLSRAKSRGAITESCVICLDHEPNAVFLKCAHFICCFQCAVKVEYCPFCRDIVHRVEEV